MHLHRDQERKGAGIPYLSHLMQVAGLVIEAGGDEDQAIAALLHDAVEDAHPKPADEVREEIEERFGERVLEIVEGCTDADVHPKPEWKPRKVAYIQELASADPSVLMVSAADKLHNARSILTDLREHGLELWDRFTGGRQGSLWYYRDLANAYRAHNAPLRLVNELDAVVTEIERLDRSLEPATG